MAKANPNRESSIEYLRQHLAAPSNHVFIVTKQAARSGMSRQLLVFMPKMVKGQSDGREYLRPTVENIGWHVHNILGYRLDRDTHAITIRGCGMDMHFALTYELSVALFGNGYELKKESL